MQLRVTDGTTTVDLSGGTTGIRGCTYFPLPGESLAAPVAETVELIGQGTEAQIRSATNAIERLLDGARRRQALGTGVRVFLEYKPVSSDALFRSELLDGRVVWSEEPGARRLGETNPRVKMGLLVSRAPWWEGPETELQLSANGQAAATGGRTITNNGSANWVQIAGSQVAGTLPAPLKLQLKNTVGSAQGFRYFWVGNNAFGNPTAFGHVVQGESRVAGYGTVTALGTCSGGQYVNLTLGTSGAIVCMWLLPAAMMAAGGRWFRLLMRLAADCPVGVTVRWSIRDEDGFNELWSGQEQLLASGDEAHDCGVIPVPPGQYDASYGQVRLVLWAKATGAASLGVDYLSLLGTDALRSLSQVGTSMANNESVEIDEIDDRVYMTDSSLRYPFLVKRGSALVVWPGVTQQLVTVASLSSGDAPIANTFAVRAWYRARRGTV